MEEWFASLSDLPCMISMRLGLVGGASPLHESNHLCWARCRKDSLYEVHF
jgi:hypothetical protein